MDKVALVYSSKGPVELNYFFPPKWMLLFALVQHMVIRKQRVPDPLMESQLILRILQQKQNRMYSIYMCSVLLYTDGTGNPVKSSKKSFRLTV